MVPYDDKEAWSQHAMLEIQRFLMSKGFVIRDMVSQMHYYHLKDNPVLQSATIIVDRLERCNSNYTGRRLPVELVKNLYGSPRRLPHYINIDPNDPEHGVPDYEWEYGTDNF